MKPYGYFPLVAVIVSILLIGLFNESIRAVVSDEQFGLLLWSALGGIVLVAALAGFFFQRRTDTYRMRPLIYWPLIGLLAAMFTKGSIGYGIDYSIFAFWIGISLMVGGLVEWRQRVARLRAGRQI